MSEKIAYQKKVISALIMFNLQFVSAVNVFSTTVREKLDAIPKELQNALFGAKERLLVGDNFECVDKNLTVDQRKLVTNYVNMLGSTCAFEQLKVLHEFDLQFKNALAEVEQRMNKYSGLYVKLSFALGLGVVVIIF